MAGQTSSPLLAQEYLRLQEALGEALRSGHLNMAKARYAMGPKHPSWLQRPKRMDAAAAGLRVHGELQASCAAVDLGGRASHSASHSADGGEVQLTEREAGGVESAASPPSAPEAVDALSAALSGVQLAGGGGDLLGELAAKYECDYPTAPPGDAAGPRSPLLWYGQLVPPALKEAQADFKLGAQLQLC